MCPACCMRRQAAGHDGVGGVGPHQAAALDACLNHAGCPAPGLTDRHHVRRSLLPKPLSLFALDQLRGGECDLVVLLPGHDGPCDAGHFVGHGDGNQPGRFAFEQLVGPTTNAGVLAPRIASNRGSADHEQVA